MQYRGICLKCSDTLHCILFDYCIFVCMRDLFKSRSRLLAGFLPSPLRFICPLFANFDLHDDGDIWAGKQRQMRPIRERKKRKGCASQTP